MKNTMPNITIQNDVSLAQFSTFQIGGKAKYFCCVKDESELLEALKFSQENKLKYFILGGGSNILFSDNGFDGLVVKMQKESSELGGIKIIDDFVECWAGESLLGVVNFFRENDLTGMEWAVGIPGTIGGAVRGNAGAYGGEMKDIVEEVRLLKVSKDNNETEIITYKNIDCCFSYRSSIFKEKTELVILSMKLKAVQGSREEIRSKMKEYLGKRISNQPKGFSAGSFFQNPIVSDSEVIAQFEKDTGVKMRGEKIPAGWLIEEIGFRGRKIGGALVSEKHANFIINTGNAKAEDVVILAGIIKQKIRKKFKIQLKEEIVYVGF